MRRHSFEHDGLVFSFLDAGDPGKPLIALHGHWMGASDFAMLAEDLAPEWRLIALDQRGFGETDHAVPHSMHAYVSDVASLLNHLSITGSVPIIGHSFGGVVAYHFAAAHPERVSAMVIEDIGVNIQDDSSSYVANWGGLFRLREALEERLGPRLSPYLQNSIHRVSGGWTLNFDPTEFLVSERSTNGDHWNIWLHSQCPALVVSGSESRVCDAAELKTMAERRVGTKFAQLHAGHSVHIDARKEFADLLRQFLKG